MTSVVERRPTIINQTRFDSIVPERLRLWDECNWSHDPDSLIPFEYGPSSEESENKYGDNIRMYSHEERIKRRQTPEMLLL